MTTFKKFIALTLTVAAISPFAISAASAGTFVQETTVTPKPTPGSQQVNFDAFDINHDGLLSMPEVGSYLFKAYDLDGNGLIDNREYENKMIMTIGPAQRETTLSIDYNGDGRVDQKTVSTEDFMQASGLTQYDKNMDGLTPHDFIGMAFNQLDDNNSQVIEAFEWKRAYTARTTYPNADQYRYND